MKTDRHANHIQDEEHFIQYRSVVDIYVPSRGEVYAEKDKEESRNYAKI